jgi:hypothetical protein
MSMAPRVLPGLIDIELPVCLLDQRNHEPARGQARNDPFDECRFPAAGSAGKTENLQWNLTSIVSIAQYDNAADHPIEGQSEGGQAPAKGQW